MRSNRDQLSWFYIDTNMMLFVIVAVLVRDRLIALLGYSANALLTPKLFFKALVYYFALFGFVAPVRLAFRAAWGAALARESKWRY